MNRVPFAPDEWYHCYTRGVDKRQTFFSPADYERFLELLYLCNNKQSVHRSNLKTDVDIFLLKREEPLVHIGAYCLMPNHFHLVIKEAIPSGITSFMRKLGTGYTMYFNKKHERIGNLFVKPFRSRHLYDDSYAKRALAHVHLNPLDLFDKTWKETPPAHTEVVALKKYLHSYRYSSMATYTGDNSKEAGIISPSAMSFFRNYQHTTSIEALLADAADFFLSR